MRKPVSADPVNAEPGCNLSLPVVEGNPVRIGVTDEGAHLVDHDAPLHSLPMRIPPRDITHLIFLYMKDGIGEFVEIADMVPVHMCDDDIADGLRLDADLA